MQRINTSISNTIIHAKNKQAPVLPIIANPKTKKLHLRLHNLYYLKNTSGKIQTCL